MTPQGADVWVKAGIAFVAVDFILSLPSWALGLMLILALVARYGVERLRAKDGERNDAQPSSDQRRDDR